MHPIGLASVSAGAAASSSSQSEQPKREKRSCAAKHQQAAAPCPDALERILLGRIEPVKVGSHGKPDAPEKQGGYEPRDDAWSTTVGMRQLRCLRWRIAGGHDHPP